MTQTAGTSASANILAQVAMIKAFDDCYPWAEGFVKHLQKCRDYVYQRLSNMEKVKANFQEATFVAFPDISAVGVSSDEFVDICRNKYKLSLVPGNEKWFGPGAAGHVRICYSTNLEVLKEGMDRFEACVNGLGGR